MKLFQRCLPFVAAAALATLAGCGASEAKAVASTPPAEEGKSCCSDGSGNGDPACAADGGGCCAEDAKN